MISAMTPPKRKNENEAIRYMYPMTLWSVEVIHFTSVRPNLRRVGSAVVMPSGSGAGGGVDGSLSDGSSCCPRRFPW